MADEALRMQAEVQDKFSGPLKALRSQLLDTARTGANHSETLAKGFKAVEGTMQSTARTASSVVNPAFAALGVTGLTAGAAVAGISAALNKLTGNLTGLGQLTRDTGIAAKTLQEFGAVAGRFGIEQEAVAQGAKNFAAQMRTFAKGTGDAFNWVIRQGTNAAGRKAFQDFATDLQHTSDEGEKLKKALTFMETIKNPVERGIFARQFFGNDDFQRLADQHLGTVTQMFKQARERLGAYDPADIINAEKFDRSLSSLRSSMQRFGLTVAREVLGPATDFTTWMDSLVSGQRSDLTKSLREGLQGVKKELGDINWHQAGEDAKAFLEGSTALAGSMARTFHEIADAIHSIREGNIAGAARGLDSASGPLARRLAPRVGDDEIAAQEDVDRLRKLKDLAGEAQGHFIGRTQQRLGLLGTPEQAGKNLEDAEARLKALQGRSPEQRQQDFESSDKLRRSIDSLTDEMKASRSGATVQRQSMDTQGGLFGDATVQTASYGGGGFRRPGRPLLPEDPVQREARRRAGEANVGNPDAGWFGGRPGGGSGPGYSGEQGGRAFGRGRFNPLGGRSRIAPIGPRPNLPGGDQFTTAAPGAPGTYRPQRQLTDRDLDDETIRTIAGEARLGNPGGVDAVINNMFNRLGTKGWGPSRDLHDVARAPGQYEGYNPRVTAMQAEQIRSRIRAIATGSVPDNTKGSNSFRASWYRGPWWKRHGQFGQDIGGNTFAFDPSIPNGPYASRPGKAASAERADGGDASFFPNVAPRVLKPNSMKDAPGLTMDEANKARSERADGAGWAAREAARKTFESQQAEAESLRASGARVASAASRAGVVAMPQIENNGSVVVNVHKAGPETRVATTASGKLFQDVVQRSGAQMRRAD